MKFTSFLVLVALSTTMGNIAFAQTASNSTPVVPRYLITNDDSPPKTPTSSTLFTIASGGLPQSPLRVSLGGVGAGGGYFAASRVSVLQSATAACAFLSLGGSGEISAVDLHSQRDIGNFSAAPTDTGISNGIGLVNNGTYLWASFSSSNTIATFSMLQGCGLVPRRHPGKG